MQKDLKIRHEILKLLYIKYSKYDPAETWPDFNMDYSFEEIIKELKEDKDLILKQCEFLCLEKEISIESLKGYVGHDFGYYMKPSGANAFLNEKYLKEIIDFNQKNFSWKSRLIPWIISLSAIGFSVYVYFNPPEKNLPKKSTEQELKEQDSTKIVLPQDKDSLLKIKNE